MCFFVSKKYPNALIAEEDIICKKIVHKCKWYNIRQLLSWSLFEGKIYKSEITGYYYSTNFLQKKITIQKENKLGYSFFDSIINNGYHSYYYNRFFSSNNYLDVIRDKNTVLIACIIPKGSMFFKNDARQEYVSDNIIITNSIISK